MENSGLISFRLTDLIPLLYKTLKSLLQHHSSKASILRGSVFFMVQLSHPYVTTGKISMKEESEKIGLKLNIQKTKIMASSPLTSWQINGETVETVATLFVGAPKLLQMVTAAMKLEDTYSLEGKL